MKTSRRTFLKSASAGTAAGLISQPSVMGAEAKSKKTDSTVSKYTGPFGKGIPITMAGYEYSRVKAIVEGIAQRQHRREVLHIPERPGGQRPDALRR